MSRCFPFPPRGYAGKCSSNEALILSIKPPRENQKANSDREREKGKSLDRKKEKKREKKERKRQKEKSNHTVNGVKEKLVEKLYETDDYKAAPKDKFSLRQNESELLEKSSLTEEHCQPIDVQKASCSSDSTGNSSKRGRSSTPPSSIQSQGNILRIRLSSHKSEEPSTSGRKEQGINLPLQKRGGLTTSYSNFQPCSNLLREESSIKQKNFNLPQDNNINLASSSHATTSRQDQKAPPVLSEKMELAPPKEKLSSHEKKVLKRESQYEKLFESWVPPMLQSKLVVVDDDGDEDWLFGRKGEEKPAKRLKVSDLDKSSDSLSRCASAVMQPRAEYLSDVEIYALPFSLPL